MEDVELSELVRRFQSLQKEQVSNQITERNAVEIVNALIQKKLIDLLFTTDAKEYLTWDELKREIVDEVLANGGRLNVVDLPGLLSVHTFQVERVLPSVLEENPTLTLEAGELMTDSYLDSIVMAAGDLLKEQGSLAVSQFASMNQLSSLFARNLLSSAMDRGRIEAVLQDSSLYTKQFVKLQCMIARAGLLAAEEPVRMEAFYKRNQLFTPLLGTVVEELRGTLPGRFDGTHTYVPHVYEAKRSAQVHNLYASNGYVEYAPLQRQEIHNPRPYLIERYNPPEAAEAKGATSPATASAPAPSRKGRRKGAGGKGGAVAGAGAGNEGPRVVVRASAEFPLCGYPLANGFVSDRYLTSLPGLQSLVDGETLAVDVAEQLPLFVEVERDWPVLEERLRELYPGLEGARLIANAVLLSAAAEEKIKTALPAALTAATKTRTPVGTVVVDAIAAVLKLPRDRYDEVLHELADTWSGLVDAVQQQLTLSAAKSAAADLKQTRAALQEELATRWTRLWVGAKGIEWAVAQVDEATSAALVRHIMSTEVCELARLLIRNESLDSPECSAKVAAALEQATQPAQLKKALVPFSESRRNSLMPIVDTVNGKSLEAFLDTLREMGSSGVVAVAAFHPPNKKTERDVYAKLREAAAGDVAGMAVSTEDAAVNGKLLAALCTLLVHQRFRCHLEVPGKAVAGVVARLKSEAEVPAGLEAARDTVMADLQRNVVDAAGANALEELRKAALALV